MSVAHQEMTVPGLVGVRRAVAPTRAERRLAAGLRARDERALRMVHDQYGTAVFGYLVHTLRDHAAAEDVFQQVLTEIWRRGAEYDPARASLITWVLTITRSRAVDELRRRRPEPFDPVTLPEHPVGAPQDAVLDRWRTSHLLSQLPAEERQLLELRFYHELSQREIAERTGLAMGTIKGRMVRGLERLRMIVDAEELA
jgi:RNA polymerase sigma-70 factor (ECF subfamily)